MDDWVERIAIWKEQVIGEVDFFVHQNIEKASPLLSAHFIKNAIKALGENLNIQ